MDEGDRPGVERARRAKQRELKAHQRAIKTHESASKYLDDLGHGERADAARSRAREARKRLKQGEEEARELGLSSDGEGAIAESADPHPENAAGP